MKENGFEYVDLGLPSGTMWATCNVGANKSEEPGLLFQWGRTDGYKNGDKNHKFRTNQQNLEDGSSSEYIPVLPTGNKYESGEILKHEDDTAHVNMGGKWGMPTNEQYLELYNTTDQAVIKDKGMLFTSKINGKRLFVPFAGYWYNGSFSALGSVAYVWSSQVHSSNVDGAYRLHCYSGGDANVYCNYRTFAFSVRGVFKK